MIQVLSLPDAWTTKPLADLLPPRDLSTLQGLLATQAKCVAIEFDYIDRDYRNVLSNYYTKKFADFPGRANRLHFFEVLLTEADFSVGSGGSFLDLLDAKARKAGISQKNGSTPAYLGFVVVRPTEYSKLGRTVIDPRRLAAVSGRSVLARFEVNLDGLRLTVSGFPHQAQDAEAHVCAQTAIWGLFRYLSQRYHHYPERYPHDITLLNSDLRFGRRLPGRGLYMDQIAAIFGEFGLGAEMYVRDDLHVPTQTGWASINWKDQQDYYEALVVSYLESGMPPVLGLSLPHGGHAVTAFGIQQGGDSSSPGLRPSADTTHHWIVNDDNLAPYATVNSGGGKLGSAGYATSAVDSMVVPYPDKLLLTAVQADIISTDLLNRFPAPSEAPRFRRLLATSSKNYKAFQRQNWSGDPVSQLLIDYPMPHFLWLAEYYTTDGWNSERVLAEVAIDATAGQYDSASYLWIRLEDKLIVNENRFYGHSPVKSFRIPSEFTLGRQYRGNLQALN